MPIVARMTIILLVVALLGACTPTRLFATLGESVIVVSPWAHR